MIDKSREKGKILREVTVKIGLKVKRRERRNYNRDIVG